MKGRAANASPDLRLARLIERAELDGAFFLHGDANRLVHEAAARLIEAALDPTTRDFNLDVFRGSETQPEGLASALATPPVMAPRRVVALFDAQDLAPAARTVVENTVASLPPGLAFVITARVPERSKAAFYRRLGERCTALEWPAPRAAEIPGWLIERAGARYGLQLAERAAEALAGAVGEDPDLLDAELAKLAAAATDGTAGLDQVRALVPNVRPVDRWAWLDRVTSREYRAAGRELPALLAEPRESAVGLLAGLVEGHVCLGLALEGGASAVASALAQAGKPYLKWKARAYAAHARRWTPAELERALRLLRRADRRAKSGGADDRAVLEELLLALEVMTREAA